MSEYDNVRIGLFGIGLAAYWPQFAGLEERLRGYVDEVAQRVERPGVELVNLGLIDDPEKAMAAGHDFRRADVDLILLYVTTYALSSTVLPVVQRAKVPVLILNVQPVRALDYAAFNAIGDRTEMTGEKLAHVSVCPVPEIANVFSRAGIPFYQVTGTLEADDPCWAEVDDWIDAARVANALFHNRLGLMGHCYNGMLDIHSDVTGLLVAFGGHAEIVEVDELSALRREVTEGEVSARMAEFEEALDIREDCTPQELARAARTSLALDRLVERHRLGALAYYAMGSGNAENEDTMSSVILGNSLLTARGVPVAGEYEVKNAIAMKIMDEFGAGGSFTEFYMIDWDEDIVIMGHDGPGHIAIAEGKTRVRPLEVYHGKVGRGLSVEMAVRRGPVTLLSVVQDGKGRAAAGGGGGVRGRADPGGRQYEQPLSLPHRRAPLCRGVECGRVRRITARWAWGTLRAALRAWATCWAWRQCGCVENAQAVWRKRRRRTLAGDLGNRTGRRRGKHMIRKAFLMSVNADQHAEYERRHNPIWEELAAVLKAHGVHNYSIYLDAETNSLFAYAEVEDEAQWDSIAQEPVVQKWWRHMADVMPSNADNSPVARDLREVFHLA